MAGSNPSIGGDNEIEYIPFYGELNMTTFTTEDRKEAAKKPKKEKVTIKQSAPEVAEAAIVKEIVTTRTEAVIEELQTSKAAAIEKVLARDEYVKPIEEYTPTDFAAVNDPPEPGVADVASTPKGAHIVRRGFTTIQMAQAFLARLKNPEDFVIVEVREGNGLMIDGPILAHYVIHKAEEL
jgi:hypothetical protein